MRPDIQPRKLILLEDDSAAPVRHLREILQSPLGLTKKLVCLSFGVDPPRGLLLVKQKLDSIKRLAAGLASAEQKSAYKVADYAVYLFAFQQFFHSSYRARQGNVLEEAIRRILTDAGVTVYPKNEHKKVLERQLGIATKSGHDVDVVASNKEYHLLVQIRSRDDTGGTTAKGSLVELLRDVLREKIEPKSRIRYVIYVWEPLQQNQKQSLINKVLGELEGQVEPTGMEKRLDTGRPLSVRKTIELQLAYGPEQFEKILLQFTGNEKLKDVIKSTLISMSAWDDLWLSYAIASLELERMIMRNKSNFEILNEKFRGAGISIRQSDLEDYVSSSRRYAEQMVPEWSEESLPVASPKDQLTYIRDLVLLKMIHYKIRGECASLVKQFLGDKSAAALSDFG